jgi:hypothetical protein
MGYMRDKRGQLDFIRALFLKPETPCVAGGENRLIDWALRTQNISQWWFIESNRKQLGMFAHIVQRKALRNSNAHSREY